MKICPAITINEGKEQSFCKAVGQDLTDSVFSNGHLYFRLSTVLHLDKLKEVLLPNTGIQTKSVVHV